MIKVTQLFLAVKTSEVQFMFDDKERHKHTRWNMAVRDAPEEQLKEKDNIPDMPNAEKKKRFHTSCFWSSWLILAVSSGLADDSINASSFLNVKYISVLENLPKLIGMSGYKALIKRVAYRTMSGPGWMAMFNSKWANTYALGGSKAECRWSSVVTPCLERPDKQTQRANKPHRSTREKHHLWFPHLNWPLFFGCGSQAESYKKTHEQKWQQKGRLDCINQ